MGSPGSEVRKVARLIQHPDFLRRTVDNDIALLELESPVTYSAVIRPICLPTLTPISTVKSGLSLGGGRPTLVENLLQIYSKYLYRLYLLTTVRQMPKLATKSRKICSARTLTIRTLVREILAVLSTGWIDLLDELIWSVSPVGELVALMKTLPVFTLKLRIT